MDKGKIMDRQQAHQLLDQLDPSQFDAVVRLLEVMTDPVTRALANAPIDDEPVTEEEESAVAEAREWLLRNGGKGIPHEEAMRRLGLE
jgi:hypothetical protein